MANTEFMNGFISGLATRGAVLNGKVIEMGLESMFTDGAGVIDTNMVLESTDGSATFDTIAHQIITVNTSNGTAVLI